MITEKQRLERRNHIGSSDAANIMLEGGHEVWASKVLAEVPESEVPDWFKTGNELEPILVKWAAEQEGLSLQSSIARTAKNPVLEANLDALSYPDERVIVEAKTCGINNFSPEHAEFGREGTDEVPTRILIQVAHQFACVPTAEIALVPAWIGGRGKVLFRLKRDDEFVEAVATGCLEFWDLYVKTKTMPPGVPPMEILKRVERMKGKRVEIADELANSFLELREARLAAEKQEEFAKAALIASLGDAEEGRSSTHLFRYPMEHRDAHTVKESNFRKLYPRKLTRKDYAREE